MSAPPVCSYNMTTLTPLVYKLLPEVLQFSAQSPPTQPLAGVNIIFKLKGPHIRKKAINKQTKKIRWNLLGPDDNESDPKQTLSLIIH